MVSLALYLQSATCVACLFMYFTYFGHVGGDGKNRASPTCLFVCLRLVLFNAMRKGDFHAIHKNR